jgi:hypothetical protein
LPFQHESAKNSHCTGRHSRSLRTQFLQAFHASRSRNLMRETNARRRTVALRTTIQHAVPKIWGSATPGALTCSAKSGHYQVSPVRFAVWRLLMRLDHNSMVQEPCTSDHGVRQQYETSAFQYFLKMAVIAGQLKGVVALPPSHHTVTLLTSFSIRCL